MMIKAVVQKTVEAYVDVEVTDEQNLQGVIEFIDEMGLIYWEVQNPIYTITEYQVIKEDKRS